jgi:hypothetical protein
MIYFKLNYRELPTAVKKGLNEALSQVCKGGLKDDEKGKAKRKDRSTTAVKKVYKKALLQLSIKENKKG